MLVFNEESNEPIIFLSDEIGGSGVSGTQFAYELMRLDKLGKKRIQLWINSIGGFVFDGYTMCSAVLKSKTPVDTYNVGVAASMAAVLFMCGRKRIASDYSIMMVHNPFSSNESLGDNMSDSDKQMLETIKNSLTKIMCEKTGMDETKMSEMMSATTWLGAEECLSYGFCDEVESTSDMNKKRMQAAIAADVNNASKTALEIVNKIIQKPNIMKNVFAALQLNETASEDLVVSAINSLKTKLVDAERALTDEQKRHNELMLEVENKRVEALKAEAKSVVAQAVKDGKIIDTPEVVTMYESNYLINKELVEKALEKLPVNKKSEEIKNPQGGSGLSMAAAMGEIIAKHS